MLEKKSKTEAYQSCSVSWKNRMVVFGGESERRQISLLDDRKLRRIGHLTFDFTFGACTVISQKFIFLCFSLKSNSKHVEHHQCRRTTELNVKFSNTTLTKYAHQKSAISASNSKLNNSEPKYLTAVEINTVILLYC